jgi:eukaryotic-like serine/threonine-protein kinase
VVYEAVREFPHSRVALKVMHPQYRNRPNYLRRYHTEARSAARLHHTNFVRVLDREVSERRKPANQRHRPDRSSA